MHALRERALLHSVEALLQGRRLTLTDVARAWPRAMREYRGQVYLTRRTGSCIEYGQRVSGVSVTCLLWSVSSSIRTSPMSHGWMMEVQTLGAGSPA